MAIVIIGGQARKVGKTSVVAGLIAALPEFHWTAVKISRHSHDIAATDAPGWVITEEYDRSGGSDTSRFLVAGAERALWVRSEPRHFADAIPEFQHKLSAAQNVIIESNSILKFLPPDVCLFVVDPANTDIKASAREFIDSADAFIVQDRGNRAPAHQSGVFGLTGKPVFRITPPHYVTPEIVEFVRQRIVRAGLDKGR